MKRFRIKEEDFTVLIWITKALIKKMELGQKVTKSYPPYYIVVKEEEKQIHCQWGYNKQTEQDFFHIQFDLQNEKVNAWEKNEKEWKEVKVDTEIVLSISKEIEKRFSGILRQTDNEQSAKAVVERFQIFGIPLTETITEKITILHKTAKKLAPKLDKLAEVEERHYLKSLFSRDLPELLQKYTETPPEYQKEKEEKLCLFIDGAKNRLEKRWTTIQQGLIQDFETKLEISNLRYIRKATH